MQECGLACSVRVAVGPALNVRTVASGKYVRVRSAGAVHRAMDGCERMYFGMSVSDTHLAATVNAAAVAKHHGVKAWRA